MSNDSHASGSTRVILVALLANLGIAASKFVGAFITGSASLLAEAIHSVVDSTNQILLLKGARSSARRPDDLHPMGYGREAFFWSFIVALLLFSMGGLFAIYEGIHKLQAPEPVSKPLVALGILVFGVILEGYSFHACLTEVRKQNPFGSLAQWVRRTTASGLIVIFLEDLGALLGLAIALIALTLTIVTGDARYDAVGSLAVGVLLVGVAVVLGREIQSLLIGEAPSGDYRASCETLLKQQLPDATLIRYLPLQTGADEVMLALKIEPGSVRDIPSLIRGINAFELRVKERHPEVRWLFVEPDDHA